MNVTSTLKSTLAIQQTPATGPLAGTVISYGPNFSTVLKLSGVLADQVDGAYVATLTFVASTPQTLDLTALTDPLGNALTVARVRAIGIRIQNQTDGWVLLVGNAASNEWTGFLTTGGKLTVFPSSTVNDGWFVLTAPHTTGIVVDSTHKSLKLDPGAHALVVDVVFLTCST